MLKLPETVWRRNVRKAMVMDNLVIDLEELRPEQVAELLRIVADMRQAAEPLVALDGEEEAELERPELVWGWAREPRDLAEEEAVAIFQAVLDHGKTLGRDWSQLLVTLATNGGRGLHRDHARRLVTTKPGQQVNALRGLKQAFERAQRATRSWSGTELYLAAYQDPYSGVTSISLDPPYAATLQRVVHID